MNSKISKILLNAVPIILMIALIPLVPDDRHLSLSYLLIILVALLVKRERGDWVFLAFGFLVMTASEYFFISTGVETFSRRSLLGVMPLWLPILWSYSFVAMRRAIRILDK